MSQSKRGGGVGVTSSTGSDHREPSLASGHVQERTLRPFRQERLNFWNCLSAVRQRDLMTAREPPNKKGEKSLAFFKLAHWLHSEFCFNHWVFLCLPRYLRECQIGEGREAEAGDALRCK